MAGSTSPRGLIVDLITPLSRDGDIDGRGLGKHLDRILPYVEGLLLAGPSAGQGMNLGPQQREKLLEKALVVVRGKVPILIWITRDSEEKTRENLILLSKTVAKRNYAGQVLWVDTPLVYHSNRGLPSYYRELSSLVEHPILLYNDPELVRQWTRGFKRANIRTSILKELAQLQEIQGLIFLGPLERARNYQKAVRSRTDFKIYDGDEHHFLTYPSLSGILSAGANLAPRAWQKITRSSIHLGGNDKRYPDQLEQIWEVGAYVRSLMDVYHGASTSLIKQVLSDMGIIECPTCKFETEGMVEKTDALKEIMNRFGDYPEMTKA